MIDMFYDMKEIYTIVNGGAGYVSPISPTLIYRMPVTIGKIDMVTVNNSTGGTDPVPSSVRNGQHQLAILPPRQHDSASSHSSHAKWSR